MLWVPTASAEVENDAVPPLRDTVAREFRPSRNCTVPVDPAGETVAVNVTACPDVDGFSDDVSAVVVPIAFTICVRTGDVLAA